MAHTLGVYGFALLVSYASMIANGSGAVPAPGSALVQKAQKTINDKFESESELNQKLEIAARNGSPGDQLSLVDDKLESESDLNQKLEIAARKGSPGDQLSLVELLVRNAVALGFEQSRNGNGTDGTLKEMAETTRETLQKIHDTIETTSLKQTFAEHKASKQILEEHVANVEKCETYLSSDGLDEKEAATAMLKESSEACQTSVTNLGEARDSASQDLQNFVTNIELCLPSLSGMSGQEALKQAASIEEKAKVVGASLSKLNIHETETTKTYESASKNCSETTDNFNVNSCQIRTIIATSLDSYRKCRTMEVPLLEKEKDLQHDRAEARKRDYVAYKKIQCFIKVMKKTTPADQQKQLDFCAGEKFSTEDLNLKMPEIPAEADTTEKVNTMNAQEACPDDATTNATGSESLSD